ncbi:hypothetical protein [Crossiella sp. S99.1]|uniref:hypothetical protein n=1 Tax=Crossiella sp. S99.1 TaxID=2936271 RepID=UPI001FFF7269|nr:hypothetical protein [Crossiella sp. S99.1]MCK2241488.1 hypothetical protein [Crossiella sp. S99.2]MCK2255640.1 hypothetical protein [Crossiella sp. S99.1]
MTEPDLALFRRFATEPWLVGPDWPGSREIDGVATGFLAWDARGAGRGRRHPEHQTEQWRDGHLYRRLRNDPAPDPSS